MPDLADLPTLPTLCNYGKTRMKCIEPLFKTTWRSLSQMLGVKQSLDCLRGDLLTGDLSQHQP